MSEASKEKKPEAKQQASQGSLIYHPHGGLATYPSVLGLESTAAAFVALQQRGHELLANSPVANESVHAVQRFFAVESLPRIVSDTSKKQAIASSKLISTPLDDARVAYGGQVTKRGPRATRARRTRPTRTRAGLLRVCKRRATQVGAATACLAAVDPRLVAAAVEACRARRLRTRCKLVEARRGWGGARSGCAGRHGPSVSGRLRWHTGGKRRRHTRASTYGVIKRRSIRRDRP